MRLDSGFFKAMFLSIAKLQSAASFGANAYRYAYHGATEYEIVTLDMPADLDRLPGHIDFSALLAIGYNEYLVPVACSFTDGITTVTEDSGYNLRQLFLS